VLGAAGYLVELRGAGGIADALVDWVPQFDVWQSVSVHLDPSEWTMVSGNWAALLASVEMVRIRAEYIDGDEYVLLDNVGLSFTPVVPVQEDLVCSSFEPADGLDGWNFQNTGTISVNTTEGNPPNAIQIADQSNDLSMAYAPPKFRGDLSAWNGVGTLSFNVRVNTNLTAVLPPSPHVRLVGPGGEASVAATAPEVLLATNQWHTFSYPLDAMSWTMISGTWNDLLANVITIELTLEYYTGTAETVLLDNVCMGVLNTGLSDAIVSAPGIFPNPACSTTRVLLPWSGSKHLAVYDLSGRALATHNTGTNALDLDVSSYATGTYLIRVSSGAGTSVLPLMVDH
jgi:Secretion system C-terminal sorting domain